MGSTQAKNDSNDPVAEYNKFYDLKSLPKSYISGNYSNNIYGSIKITYKSLNSVDYIYVTFLKTNITYSGQLTNYSAILKLDLSAIYNLPDNYSNLYSNTVSNIVNSTVNSTVNSNIVSNVVDNDAVDHIILNQKSFFTVSLTKNNSEINFEKTR